MAEACSWRRGPPSRSERKVCTHSAKTKLLSWSAKFGLPKGDRRILGYHVAGKDRMVQVYSSDELAAPLRKLELVEKAVRNGTFDPDVSRSGRFKRPLEAAVSYFSTSKKGKQADARRH